jgi:hypothetical protein
MKTPLAVLAAFLCTLVLAGCSTPRSGSYLVTVHDRQGGTAIEGAVVEVRDPSGSAVVGSARSMTDGRGEAVIILPPRERADLFVTFDGETERYWFPVSRIPGYDAPREEIDGERSPVRFIAGPDGVPAWRVTVVRVLDRIR